MRLVMKPRDGEAVEQAAARAAWLETGDTEAALRQLPKHLVAERAILEVGGPGSCWLWCEAFIPIWIEEPGYHCSW